MGWRPGYPTVYDGKTAAPTVNDDQSEHYLVGDIWADETNDEIYMLIDNAEGAAVWVLVSGATASEIALTTTAFGGILSASDSSVQAAMDTIDDHLHATQTLTADGITPDSGTLTITGILDVSSNITVGGTIDGVDVATLKSDYDAHRHTAHTLENDGITPDAGVLTITGRVGVGSTPATNNFEIISTTTASPKIKFESQVNDATGMVISLFKNRTTPANDDVIADIFCYSNDSGGADLLPFTDIKFVATDITATTEYGAIRLFVRVGGTVRNLLSLEGGTSVPAATEVVVNEAGVDCNLRVEAVSKPNGLFFDGTTGFLGINKTNPGQQLVIYDDTTQAVITLDVSDNPILNTGFLVLADRPSDGNLMHSFSFYNDAGFAAFIDVFRGSTDAKADIAFGTPVEIVRFDEDGQVGIGTVGGAISGRLHVKQSTVLLPIVLVEGTSNDAYGPQLRLAKHRASPADNDVLGYVTFRGYDSAAVDTQFAYIAGLSLDVTNGDEAGGILLSILVDGVVSNAIQAYGYNATTVGQGYILLNGSLKNLDFLYYGQSATPILFGDASIQNVVINGIGVSANYDLLLQGDGVLALKETTTPTADTNYGKVYTKNDNKLYFQDGAGSEHEVAFV